MLAERFFKQGFSARKLMRIFYKFMGRYPQLASKFNKSSSSICDSVSMAQQMITQKMVDQVWFEFYVVFTVSFCAL